jgi:hypothetical protein
MSGPCRNAWRGRRASSLLSFPALRRQRRRRGGRVLNGQIVGLRVGPEGFGDLEPSGPGGRHGKNLRCCPEAQGFGQRQRRAEARSRAPVRSEPAGEASALVLIARTSTEPAEPLWERPPPEPAVTRPGS